MPLRLRHLFHMKYSGYMGIPYFFNASLKHFAHASIIPALYRVNIKAVGIGLFLHATQGGRYRALGGLHFPRNGNAITIIPNKYSQRYLHNTGGINRLPKMPFAGGGIAYGAKTYFIAVMRQCVH